MRSLRGVFLGAALWGLLTLIIPVQLLHPIFIIFGSMFLLALCMLFMVYVMDKVDQRKWR